MGTVIDRHRPQARGGGAASERGLSGGGAETQPHGQLGLEPKRVSGTGRRNATGF